ncbi:PDxFFG protein [Mycoplasma sp. 4013]
MKKLKLSLKAKVLLSASIITFTSAITVAAMYGYANNSDEVRGSSLPVSKEELKNDFSKLYNENHELTPEIFITDPSKENAVGFISPDYKSFGFNDNKSKLYSFEDFFNEYYKRYNESFILAVKYGSFTFYDEYVLAVKPDKFIDFSKWFINNVAWGPDLLTLDSFRLVPGVEQNGNAITLGSHSTLHKEVSEIKFFPDAFFGSMPVYSVIGGAGNRTDSLTYATFKDQQDKVTVDNFLATIPLASAIKNSRSANNLPFLSLYNPNRLLGETFKIFIPKTTRLEDTLILPKDLTAYTFTLETKDVNLPTFDSSGHSDAPKITYDSLVDAKVTKVTSSKPNNSDNRILSIEFSYKDADGKDAKFVYAAAENEIDPYFELNYKTFKAILDPKLKHFLDFFDVKAYEGQTLWIYADENANLSAYASKVEAMNSIDSLRDWSKVPQESKNRLREFKVKSIDVKNKRLEITLENTNTNIPLIITFDAMHMSDAENKLFEQFKDAVGYKGSINPISIKSGPEDISIVDKNGRPLRGLSTRKYQIYNEVYTGLVDKVLKKFPQLAKKLNGPHIQRTINDQGFYDYKLVEGDYYGLRDSDRIGLPLLLSATIDNYEGISTDFLKYVATHEYGHHYTLDQSQALNQDSNAVVVGGISTRGGLTETSYYSAKSLRNYLKARTNLDFVRVNALGQQTEDTDTTGQYIRFLFKDKNGKFVRETDKQIWGNPIPNSDVFSVLDEKDRRFLQDFKGMQEAAKLRGARLGDLFIANSFDENSGTLNPFIEGVSKTFEKKQIDGKDVYVFKEVAISDIVENIRDGLGKSLKDVIKIASPNSITISVVETQKDANAATIATKINVFDKDGKPAINVPLNEPLDEKSLDYISEQTNIIKSTIESLLITRFADSGWNTRDTDFGGVIGPIRKTLLQGTNFTDNGFVDSLKYRSDAVELDADSNRIDQIYQNNTKRPGTRRALEYTALTDKGDLYTNLSEIIDTYVGFILENQNRGSQFQDGYYAQLLNVFAFVKDGKIQKGYTFPLILNNHFSDKVLYNPDENGQSDLWPYARQFNSDNNASGRPQMNPAYGIMFSGFGLYNIDQDKKFVPFLAGIDADGNVVSKDTFQSIIRNPRSFSALVKKIAFVNFNKNTVKNYNLYNSFNKEFLATVKNGNQSETTAAFDDFEKFIEFTSIDYSKASLEPLTVKDGAPVIKFNWDVDYVKTKFDFDAFKAAVATSDESAENKSRIAAASDQELANELMLRFRNSDYFWTVTDFNPATQLKENQAIFSSKYGIDILSNTFTDSFYFDKKFMVDNELITPTQERTSYDALELQKIFSDYITGIVGKDSATKILEFTNTQDLYQFVGNIITYLGQGYRDNDRIWYLRRAVYTVFNNGYPSSDILEYNSTRVENLLNDKFTDYIYSIPETLTRDYVQTTYVPATADFGNLPTYLTNANEAYTGQDYVIDATKLKIWNEHKNSYSNIINASFDAVRAEAFDKLFNETKDIYFKNSLDRQIKESLASENQIEIQKLDNRNAQIDKELKTQITDEQKKQLESEKATNIASKNQLQEANKKLNEEIAKLFEEQDKQLQDTYEKVIGVYKGKLSDVSDSNGRNEDRSSSYFGKLITKSNGYFQDRYQKVAIGMQLYDDNGKEIMDDDIRLKDFKNQPIKSRPRAFFISQLRNFGIGERTVAGIFRNKRIDSLALYGYVSNEDAKKIKQLRFTDVETGEQKFLPINIKGTNNVFYLKQQGDASSKVRVEDEGYTSWISDFGVMAKYRNTLLLPKHQYYIQFVDENNKVVSDFTLGDVTQLAENGKTGTQASVTIRHNEDSKTQDKGKAIIKIDYQFNITG